MAGVDTVAEWIGWVADRLSGAGLHFGHGTDNARDEAAWLVLHVLGAPLDGSFQDWGRVIGGPEAAEIGRLVEERCRSGRPLAYLTGRAYFAGLEFEVTPDVLVPRSPIAELVLDEFRPWLDPARVRRVLDMCTGCGCIGIAIAERFPAARVDAVDVSAAALDVAARNVTRHGLGERVRLLRSDLFQAVPACRYDLIVANPPYVAPDELDHLPAEYRAEPRLGLLSGPDGLDAVLDILHAAPRYLSPGGILVCEVGESQARLEAALPAIPFLWLDFERGGSGVFVLGRDELEAAAPAVDAIIGERRDVT